MEFFAPLLFVTAGGTLGAMSRFATQEIFAAWTRLPGWLPIFAVNMLGCLLIGFTQTWLSANLSSAPMSESEIEPFLVGKNIPQGMAGLLIGFCGGLTTFSTFSLDNIFLSHGKFGQLAFNIIGSTTGGFLMALFGMFVAQRML